MGQRRKHQLDSVKIDFVHLLEHGQIEVSQMRINLSNGHASLAVSRHGFDLETRMGRKKADQFRANVAAGT